MGASMASRNLRRSSAPHRCLKRQHELITLHCARVVTLAYTPRVRICLRLATLFVLFATPAALLGDSRLPTPESVFGFRAGADYKLATYDQSIEYFRRVAAASKYV